MTKPEQRLLTGDYLSRVDALAVKLRYLREARGETQKEVALAVRVDRSTISRLEAGKIKEPSFSTVSDLGTHFRIRLESPNYVTSDGDLDLIRLLVKERTEEKQNG